MGRSYGLIDPEYGRRADVVFSDDDIRSIADRVDDTGNDDQVYDCILRELYRHAGDGYIGPVEQHTATMKIREFLAKTANHSIDYEKSKKG